jgi:hypothetical protein
MHAFSAKQNIPSRPAFGRKAFRAKVSPHGVAKTPHQSLRLPLFFRGMP